MHWDDENETGEWLENGLEHGEGAVDDDWGGPGLLHWDDENETGERV